MSNKAILKIVENSYKGFTPQEREIIGRQVSGLPARSEEEVRLYERYQHQNHEPDSGRH